HGLLLELQRVLRSRLLLVQFMLPSRHSPGWGYALQESGATSVAQSDGYVMSMQCRKRIEQGFGWVKTIGQMRQVMVRGLDNVAQMFVLNMAAYNLVRMRSLGQIRPQGTQ
ncbi:transposase, partial [Xylophilus sp.]|uniref:transposase n=1 Tax=Xylophilus sp. TaxID=2653893 RepID=UPI002D80FE7B